jgi:hypothetical protein
MAPRLAKIIGTETSTRALASMVGAADSRKGWPELLKGVVDQIIKDGSLKYGAMEPVFENIVKLDEHIGAYRLNKLINSMIGRQSAFEAAWGKLSDDQYLIVGRALLNSDDPAAWVDKIQHWLSAKDLDWWIANTHRPSMRATDVLERISKLKAEFDLPEPLMSALDLYQKKILLGQEGYPEKTVNWGGILSNVGSDRRATFDKNLIDRIRDASPCFAARALFIFNTELLRDGVFSDEADRNVRQILLPVIATNGADENKGAVQAVTLLATELSPAVALATKTTRNELSRLIDAYPVDAPHSLAVKALAESWKLPSRRRPKKIKPSPEQV